MSKPFFSIIVPTYNQADFLVQALDSLIAQTDPDWEAVVINDGSTDQTPTVLAEYAARDGRIRTFNKENGGTGSALNEGLRNASGSWICWLSSDDMFDPRKLEIHRQWIEKYPDCRFFFTYFRLLREAIGELTDHDLWGPLPDPRYQIITLFYRNYISGITICIERAAWESVGHFDESLRYAQDYDMWLRLLARYRAQFIPEWTVTNRNHAGQGSEVFPQACYFDTAKAGLRFINGHSFQQMLPWVDLNDPEAAAAAVAATLEIAAEPTAFLYALGPHDALISRLLEWMFGPDGAGTPAGEAARRVAEKMMPQLAAKLRGEPLAAQWRQAETKFCSKNRQCDYSPIVPGRLGEASCQAFFAQNDQRAAALQKYLAQFENIHIIGPRLHGQKKAWLACWPPVGGALGAVMKKIFRPNGE